MIIFNLNQTSDMKNPQSPIPVPDLYKKKLVTRLPNFPDRRIRYEFFLKNIVTNEKINFWNFINFFKVGVRKDVVFLLYKRFQTTSPRQTSRNIVIF